MSTVRDSHNWNSLAFLALCFFSGSCRLTPEGTFVNPVKAPDTELVSVSLNDYDDKDTIRVFVATTFNFSVNPGSTKLKRTEVLLDDVVVQTYSEPNGTFVLNHSNLKTGTFKFKVQFEAEANTGSLADNLGLEILVVWREWTLIIDVSPPPQPVLTQSIVDGYSVINWTGYTKSNFVNYEVVAEYAGYLQKRRTFTNPNITSWTDSSYAGGYQVQYFITVRNLSSSNSKSISINNHVDFTVAYNPTDSMATVVAQPFVYYAAFNRFVIRVNGADQVTVTDPLQTTQVFKILGPGYKVKTAITLQYYHNSAGHPTVAPWKEILTDIIMQPIPRRATKYFYNSTLQQIIGFWSSGSTARLIRMDPFTLQPIDSVTIHNGPSYSVPYGGEYAYFSRPKDLVKVNLVTHEETSFSAILTTFGSGPSVITGSSNELVSYAWFGPGSGPSPITYYERVVNTVTDAQIHYLNYTTIATNVVSNQGDFFRGTNGKIYRIDGGSSATEIGTFTYSGLWHGFRVDEPGEIIIGWNGMQIYDANTLTLKRTIPAPTAYLTYDAPKKKMVFWGSSKIHVVDINTLETKSFNVNDTTPLVINGLLLTSNGNFVKLY